MHILFNKIEFEQDIPDIISNFAVEVAINFVVNKDCMTDLV